MVQMDKDKRILEPIWLEIIYRLAGASDKLANSSRDIHDVYNEMVEKAQNENDVEQLLNLQKFSVHFKSLLECHSDMLGDLEKLSIVLDKNYGIKINKN